MKKILVVDDSTLIVNVLKASLEYLGYSVESAQDGREAIEKLADHKPDMMILDLMLPKMGGLEVIKKMHSLDYEYKRVPIIAMSTNDSDGYKKKSLSLGAKDFIKKPIDLQEVEAKILEHI